MLINPNWPELLYATRVVEKQPQPTGQLHKKLRASSVFASCAARTGKGESLRKEVQELATLQRGNQNVLGRLSAESLGQRKEKFPKGENTS